MQTLDRIHSRETSVVHWTIFSFWTFLLDRLLVSSACLFENHGKKRQGHLFLSFSSWFFKHTPHLLQSSCGVEQQYYSFNVHMPCWSAIDIGYPLELPRHIICLFSSIPTFLPTMNLRGESSSAVWASPEMAIGWAFRHWIGPEWISRKALKRWLSSLLVIHYPQILNHKFLTLDRGWTKATLKRV